MRNIHLQLHLKIKFVPRSKHTQCGLTLCAEIIAARSENHKNTQVHSVKPGSTQSNNKAVECYCYAGTHTSKLPR
jgi:hypothetical protein